MSDARWRAARAGSPLSSPNVATTSAAVWSSGRQSCSGMYPSRDRTPIGSAATSMPHTSIAALGRVGQPEQQPEHRRLAGAVGADEADRRAARRR